MENTIGDVKIGFMDGTEKEFTDIDNFKVDEHYVMLVRFGRNMFFNASTVKYIGKTFDIENRPRGYKAEVNYDGWK